MAKSSESFRGDCERKLWVGGEMYDAALEVSKSRELLCVWPRNKRERRGLNVINFNIKRFRFKISRSTARNKFKRPFWLIWKVFRPFWRINLRNRLKSGMLANLAVIAADNYALAIAQNVSIDKCNHVDMTPHHTIPKQLISVLSVLVLLSTNMSLIIHKFLWYEFLW